MDIFEVVESCDSNDDLESEDDRIERLRIVAYGFIMPSVCFFGIIGNILNLVNLSRTAVQGNAYVYMRGYSLASLLALVFSLPFALRVLSRKEAGNWTSYPQAFYHVHLELFLGNSSMGAAVLMLLALTLERHASICLLRRSPTTTRTARGSEARRKASLLTCLTLVAYLPHLGRSRIARCASTYHKLDRTDFLESSWHQVYMVLLSLSFKIVPICLLVLLNTRVMLAYRRSCRRSRHLKLRYNSHAINCSVNCELCSSSYLPEERRLMFLLGSSSLLFLICISPGVVLSLTLDEKNLGHFYYQVFRAFANLLEVTNYSFTFYIYCLFSKEYRSSLGLAISCHRWHQRREPIQMIRFAHPSVIPGGSAAQRPAPNEHRETASSSLNETAFHESSMLIT